MDFGMKARDTLVGNLYIVAREATDSKDGFIQTAFTHHLTIKFYNHLSDRQTIASRSSLPGRLRIRRISGHTLWGNDRGCGMAVISGWRLSRGSNGSGLLRAIDIGQRGKEG